MYRFIFLIPFLFVSLLLSAQPGTTSESEVQLQEIFIDGNREKLLGNWDKAIAKFEELLQKDKNNGAAAYELARVYESNKDDEKALSYAGKAVEWEPANNWYKIYLAELYQKAGKELAAAAIYEQLVKSEPNNNEFYFKWAYFLVSAGEPAKAVTVYDDLEKRMGINEETTRHKYTLYQGMGDYKKAARELETLIAAFPGKIGYRHMLATFYEQTDQKDKAREVYREILTLSPNDARAKIAVAGESKGSDDIQFLNSLKPVFENPGVSIDVKIKEILPYVNQLADTGNASQADKNLGATLLALASILEKVHPGSAKAYSVLADVLYYTGQPEKALEKYKKTLELDDSVWLVWEQVLYIYSDKKDYDNLVKASEEALDIFPNQATAYFLNGLGYNGLGKYQDAVNSLQQAQMMSAKNPRQKYEVLVELGNAFCHLRQYSQSDKAFEEVLAINPSDPHVLKNYSRCLAMRSEQFEKAKQLAAHLNDIAPNVATHEDAYAFVLYKTKDYKSAKEWLSKALQHGGENNPSVLEHYGDVLFQLGDATQAVQYWQKALDAGGKSEFLEKKTREGKLFE